MREWLDVLAHPLDSARLLVELLVFRRCPPLGLALLVRHVTGDRPGPRSFRVDAPESL